MRMLPLLSLVALLSATGALCAEAPKIVWPGKEGFLKEARVDLTGTGRQNHVRFQELDKPGESGRYRLTIDKASIGDRLDPGLRGFMVLDLDRSDRLKEIGVFTGGPSDDYAWAIYSYDGRAIHRVGRVGGVFTAQGDGSLVVSARAPGGFTWFNRHKYALTRDHRLVGVPQEFYLVPRDSHIDRHPVVTVTRPFDLLKSRDGKTVLARPAKGAKITILLWDGGKWFGVVNDAGLFGWVGTEVLTVGRGYVQGLPAAD